MASCQGSRSVAIEEKDADSIYRRAEDPDVGPVTQGESLHQIARLFDRQHTSVRGILAGGIRPPARRRSIRALSLAEREDVSRAVVAGQSIRAIAATLGRATSTISREIRRNGGAERYRVSHADQADWVRAHRPVNCKLALHPKLAKWVADKLQQRWSPQQIAGWLMRTYPDDSRGALKKELLEHLRRTRAMRRSRSSTSAGRSRIVLVPVPKLTYLAIEPVRIRVLELLGMKRPSSLEMQSEF